MKTYDVVVVGLGIVGASALRYLAGEGLRVVGVEAFGPTHGYGSSHGESRIFRRAYWEGAMYLPLLERAHAIWSELHADEPIRTETGGVFVGSSASGMVTGSRATALAGGIAHEMLDAAQLRARFPAFHVTEDMEGIFEPGAYMLFADRARFEMLDRAVRDGAALRFGERVAKISHSGEGIALDTEGGETLSCGAVVVATGAWMASQLVPEVQPFLRPTQMPIYWFRVKPGHEPDFAVGRLPVFLHEAPSGHVIYGFPSWGQYGVKIGFHNMQQVVRDPGVLDRVVSDPLRNEMAAYVPRVFPMLDPVPVNSRICYYTMSPDGNFIIDASRAHPNIAYASACSGHGFKFASAVGESVARLALGQAPHVDLTPYRLSRFGGSV